MFYNFMYRPTQSNNGILSARKAMPMKDSTSDGDSSFAMDRRVYMRTPVSSPAINPLLLLKKKWYGGSVVRDATAVMGNRVRSEVGVGSLNAYGNPMSFNTVKDVNVTRDALVRVRHIGSCAPAKKIHKYENAPVFY
jgi:hypothetical protein